MKNNQDETTNGLESTGSAFRSPRVFREQPNSGRSRRLATLCRWRGPLVRRRLGGVRQHGREWQRSVYLRLQATGWVWLAAQLLLRAVSGRRRTASSLCVSVSCKRTFVFREDGRLAHPPFAVERWQSLAWSCLRSGQVQRSRSEAGSRGWECSLLEDPSLQVVGPKCDKNKKCVGEVMET